MIKLKLTGFILALFASTSVMAERVITVCADDDMRPLSASDNSGYENKLAALIGQELQATIEYAWMPHLRGGSLRRLKNQDCDLVMGIPANFEGIETSDPYLYSSFVVVHRTSDRQNWADLDNPVWHDAKVGLEAIGREGSQPPIVQSLIARGHTQHLVAFGGSNPEDGSVYQRFAQSLIAKDIDVVVTWGPFGGQMVLEHPKELALSPLQKDPKKPHLQFAFPISLGMRAGDPVFKAEINQALAHQQHAISELLKAYGVPVVAPFSESIN